MFARLYAVPESFLDQVCVTRETMRSCALTAAP